MIQREALKYARDMPLMTNFKASLTWVRKFCVRHFLTYKTATHQSQQKNRNPEFVYQTDVLTYIKSLKSKLKKFPNQSLIFNMDETPCYFDMVHKKMIDFVGSKTKKF